MKFVTLICAGCQLPFQRKWSNVYASKWDGAKQHFCNFKCRSIYNKTGKLLACTFCSKPVYVMKRNLHKPKHFCNSSCSAKYNNVHRKCGTTRSKLEKWLQKQLTSKFPSLEVQYNQTTAIGSELDLYFPKQKLAIEINGIWHYKPIHGTAVLSRIQNNDTKKVISCKTANIQLVVIDVTSMSCFTIKRAKPFLNQIETLIKEQSW